MRKPQRFLFLYSVVVFLGVASFVSCFTAEFKKPKKEDVRWDGERNCFVPETEAFGLGTAAVLCLGLAQIVGNVVMMSFVAVVLVLSTATSMTRTQAYGEGWLDQDCYLVKDGVFVASGCLVLLALGALIVAATKIGENKLVDRVNEPQHTKNHEQEQEQDQDQDQITQKKRSETVVSIVEEANSTTNISRI